MIVCMLLGCVYVFGYSDFTDRVQAAPCIQECESNRNECNDFCHEDCSEDSTDPACYSCLQSCSQTYFQCLGYAVSCQGLDVNPGRCSVNFGLHCVPQGGGWTCNTQQGAYYGYYLICRNPMDEECVSCTGGYCTGANPNLPNCFGWLNP